MKTLIYNLFIIYSRKHSLPQERAFFTKLVPKFHYLRSLESAYYILTHFKSMFHFCIPWKRQKKPQRFSVVFKGREFHYLRSLESAYYILTHFKSMFLFCIPWKRQKNPQRFSVVFKGREGEVETKHWLKMC